MVARLVSGAAQQAQPPQAQPLYESPEPIASALATALPTPLPPPVRPPASASASHVRVEQVEGDTGKDAGRVLVLPRNSSWADALRVEAAEKQLMVRGEAAMLHGSGSSGVMPPVPDTGALLPRAEFLAAMIPNGGIAQGPGTFAVPGS